MTTGLRERKKLATRLAIHQAALQLVAERGLDGVSVDDVAARAEISPRTFFNYFPSKDDAVLGLDPATADRVAQGLAARPADESPLAALRAVQLEEAAAMAAEPEGLWPLRLRVIEAHPVLVARLHATFGRSERALAEAVAARTGTHVDADVYPTLLAAVAGAAMRTALHRWLAGDFTVPLPRLVDETWDALAAGLPAPRT
ncbi:acyl-CoA-like ligand-binding transcription factor [Geodermatophilus sp. URMC 63]